MTGTTVATVRVTLEVSMPSQIEMPSVSSVSHGQFSKGGSGGIFRLGPEPVHDTSLSAICNEMS